MQDHVFEYIEIEEAHGKFKLYLKSSGHYVACFNDQREAVKVATAADRAIWAKQNEQLVEPHN